MPRLITFSEISTLFRCPKSWEFRYDRGLRPRRKSTALGESGMAHESFELFYKGASPEEALKLFDDVDSDKLNESSVEAQQRFLRMKALLSVYFNTRGARDRQMYDFEHVEVEFSIPLTLPGICDIPDVNFAGKIDGIWKDKKTGVLQVVEHKFLAQFSESRNTLLMDLQVSLYAIAAREVFGVVVPLTLYNVCRKPMHRMKKTETSDEYYQRVLGEVSKDPEKYFVRIPVVRGSKDFSEAFQLLKYAAEMLRKDKPFPYLYRNVGLHCTMMCSYLDICMDESPGLIDHLFEVADKRHQELNQSEDLEIAKGGSE